MSLSWLQLIIALAIMYSLVFAAGYWGKRKRLQQEERRSDRQEH